MTRINMTITNARHALIEEALLALSFPDRDDGGPCWCHVELPHGKSSQSGHTPQCKWIRKLFQSGGELK